MANNLYTTKTAALKATKADVTKLNVKTIFVGGENILDIIKRATPNIKHSQDTRETVTENDLWGQYIETKSDGTVIIHDDEVVNPNGNYAWNTSITKIEDNKAYIGDTLFANIQTENIKNDNGMFYNCNALTTFTSDLSSLNRGHSMFRGCSNLTTFNCDDLSSLTNGTRMFDNCSNLTSFTSDLSSLTYGNCMFSYCSNLTSFTSDLSSLTYGGAMFQYCSNLTSFTYDLSSLTYGGGMFDNCTNLTSFTYDLSSLTYGGGMFQYCSNLTTFTSDLSSLTNGFDMFRNCTNLTSFTSDLSSLTYGDGMFYKTKLTPQSVMYIVDSIKDIDAEKKLYQDGVIPYVTLANGKYSSPKGFMSDGKYVYTYNNPQPYTTTISAPNVGKLTIGINVTNNSSTIQDQLQTFAEEATFDSWADLKQAFVDKGWTVTWQYGGTTTSITYGLRDGEQIIPCPIFAKLVQVEDKDSAEYCTEDASTFYNIEWGHDVTNYDDFQQFDSLEDAMASWNVSPKENIISTEE